MEYLHINGSIDSHFPETAVQRISIFRFWVVSISLWINHAVAVQSVSHVPKDCSTPAFPVLHCLLEFAQTNVHSVSDTIHLPHPLSFSSLFASNLSQHQHLFQWVGSLHQVAKVLELHFSSSPSSEYSGWISFRIDWFDLAVQGTFKSLPQHYSSKASILWRSPSSQSNCGIHTWPLEKP